MEAAEKIRLSEQQVARLDAGGLVTIRASWDEFWEFLPETRYRTEYHNGHIIIMGLAAFYHEVLIMTIGKILSLLLEGKGFYVAGSNVGILKEERKGYYNPDVTVVKGKPTFRNDSTAIITNPYVVVEVLSESTAQYDLYQKLPKYQRIATLQEVVFVDRFDVSVTVCRRTDTPNTWTQTFYEQPDEQVRLAGEQNVSLRDFFANLPAEALGDQAAE